MWKDAKWIGISSIQIRAEQIYAGDLNGRFAFFRKSVVCGKQPGRCVISITANTRYRLWINGSPVLSGPCKGDRYSHYYETVDVAAYLRTGENVFAVQVLFLNPYDVQERSGSERIPILSAVSSPVGHRLALEGEIFGPEGECMAELTTGATDWQVYLDSAYYTKCREVICGLGGVCEDVDFRREPVGWKEPGYVCRMAEVAEEDAAVFRGEGPRTKGFRKGDWWKAVSFESILPDAFSRRVGFIGKFTVRERPIPLLTEEEGLLTQELGTEVFRKGGKCLEEITVEPGETVRVVFSLKTIVNAYMRYSFFGGAGGRVRFTYFEKFVAAGEEILRDDYENGRAEGLSEEILLSGEPLTFEPFWVRTFRFLEIVLEAGEEPIRFARPRFRRTGYPVKRISRIQGREPWVEEVWEMCVATLENCMLETYMDCPFYEQMQFLMDTRLQALFHYVLDGDVRLAEKALWEFHCSMTPEGLMQGKYPCSAPQVISTFSLYFVYMLQEYYWQTGNAEQVKRYCSDVDMILEYFDRHIGEKGLVEQIGYWAFVDWQDAWAESAGVPRAAEAGPSTIHNLMYAYALQCGGELAQVIARGGLAAEYRHRQQEICRLVRALCWDSRRGMYREGPDCAEYSQHAQSWAVLNGMGCEKERRNMMLHAMRDQDVVPCSFAASYELFRALEKEGLYGETEQLMARWTALLEMHCTTCPEKPGRSRSENHAWSALPMYEMIRKYAGVEPGAPGWKRVRIQPHLEYLTGLQGQAATPVGAVTFSYFPAGEAVGDETAGRIRCLVTLPRGLSGSFCLPDGSCRELGEGENSFWI